MNGADKTASDPAEQGLTGESQTLLFFCYGPETVYDQTVFAVLTVLRFAKAPRAFRIVIYCDRPQAFVSLPVETIFTDAKLLDHWLGGSNYLHRRKTCVLIDALERFGGKVVFLDSDTYAIGAPGRLFNRVQPGNVCFHLCEGMLFSTGTPFDRALAAQLISHPPSLQSGGPVSVNARTRMWNTGVVGIHVADLPGVREALLLSDAIWAGADPNGPYGRKIHHAEQFAMGYVFRHHDISEATDLIHHYWPASAKQQFAAVLPELVQSGLADPSSANLDRLYRRRFRERGWTAIVDRFKMALRRLALLAGVSAPGVRRSI